MIVKPKQTTRMKKVVCPRCGYLIRVSRMWLATGCPTCVCGEKMQRAAEGKSR